MHVFLHLEFSSLFCQFAGIWNVGFSFCKRISHTSLEKFISGVRKWFRASHLFPPWVPRKHSAAFKCRWKVCALADPIFQTVDLFASSTGECLWSSFLGLDTTYLLVPLFTGCLVALHTSIIVGTTLNRTVGFDSVNRGDYRASWKDFLSFFATLPSQITFLQLSEFYKSTVGKQ